MADIPFGPPIDVPYNLTVPVTESPKLCGNICPDGAIGASPNCSCKPIPVPELPKLCGNICPDGTIGSAQTNCSCKNTTAKGSKQNPLKAPDSGNTTYSVVGNQIYFQFVEIPSSGYSLIVDTSTINGIYNTETSFVATANSTSGAGNRYYRLTILKEGNTIFRIVYANASSYNGNFDDFNTGGFKWSYPIVATSNATNINVNASAPVTVIKSNITAQVNTTIPAKTTANVTANSTASKPTNATVNKQTTPEVNATGTTNATSKTVPKTNTTSSNSTKVTAPKPVNATNTISPTLVKNATSVANSTVSTPAKNVTAVANSTVPTPVNNSTAKPVVNI